jgi:hypothetical protein
LDSSVHCDGVMVLGIWDRSSMGAVVFGCYDTSGGIWVAMCRERLNSSMYRRCIDV